MELIYIADLDSIHTIRWINYFADLKDFEIKCISLGTKCNYIHRNVDLYRLNGFKNFIDLKRSISLLSSRKKSIVHVHYLGWNALLLFFANKNKTIILTPWGSDIYLNRNNFLKRIILKFMFRKCNFIIADSDKLIKASYKLGAFKKNTKVISFGTDTKKFYSSKKAFTQTKSKKIFRIGTNRRMERIYDPLTLLKAAKVISKYNHNLKFILANDGSLKNKIESYINKNNLQNIVEFIGVQNGNDNINFYKSIDIYVSTSLSDGGLSASIAEAMSCERLVIVSNNSDNSKYIKHGENGYLFRNKDYLSLARLITESIDNLDKSKKIAKEGRKVILEKCNYNLEMKKVNDIYKKFFN